MEAFTSPRETIGRSPVRLRSPLSGSLRQGRKNRVSPSLTTEVAAYPFFFTEGSSPSHGLIRRGERRAILVYFLTA